MASDLVSDFKFEALLLSRRLTWIVSLMKVDSEVEARPVLFFEEDADCREAGKGGVGCGVDCKKAMC